MQTLETTFLIISLLADICRGLSSRVSALENFLQGPGNVTAVSPYRGDWENNACSFTGYRPAGNLFGAAISPLTWHNGGYCGACMNLRGPKGNTVKTMVMDKCWSCNYDMRVFDDAYYQLAPRNQDRVNAEVGVVSCNFNTPLAIQNREGTSQFWFSMQVMNANWPVYDMDVSIDGGRTWVLAVSREYNFFEHPTSQSFGVERVDLKITCANGKIVHMRDVSVSQRNKQYANTNC